MHVRNTSHKHMEWKHRAERTRGQRNDVYTNTLTIIFHLPFEDIAKKAIEDQPLTADHPQTADEC